MIDSDGRTPTWETMVDPVKFELLARIPRHVGDVAPEERAKWRHNPLSPPDHWVGVRESAAFDLFDEPVDAESAVIADAMVKAGTVSDDLYARLLAVVDRRYGKSARDTNPPVTRAVAFDAFGTLVRITAKHHPFERLILQAREAARSRPSPMIDAIGLADYAATLGLPHPQAELAMLGEELVSIELYPDALDCLRHVRDQGVQVAVASNLAMPYAAPLRALLGAFVDVWHFSFETGAIKPDAAFYAPLIAKLGCKPEQLLMVGDTWADDVVGAVEAGARARWLDRGGRASPARRFVAIRSLDKVGVSLRTRKRRPLTVVVAEKTP